MAYKVQRRLMVLKIKYRPTKPRSPHLNGKVERLQRTDEEFYDLVDFKVPNSTPCEDDFLGEGYMKSV
ncbi:hypothetical protein IQ238_25965 [Pleurocapsales cyanobacterium LEGE 06147]|nr:hypothetical protein [Pleurocapsales cyanobacterium LEGE 06147]